MVVVSLFALLAHAGPIDPLAGAVDAWTKKDAAACEKFAQDTLQNGGLSVDDTARAWLLRGSCYAMSGDGDKAERSYSVALRIARDVKAPDGQTPIDDAWKRAQSSLPPPDHTLSASATIAGDTVSVALVVDDLQLVKAAAFVRADGEDAARFPLSAAEATHKISGVPLDNLALVLFDKHNNAVWKTNLAAPAPASTSGATTTTAAASAATAATPEAPKSTKARGLALNPANVTILTAVGVGAIGLGFAGVVVSGVEAAGLGPAALDKGQLWLAGAGASAAVLAVGATLVVVDQGLSPN